MRFFLTSHFHSNSNSSAFELPIQPKKASRRSSPKRPVVTDRSPSSSSSSSSSVIPESHSKMLDLGHKRLSFAGSLHSAKSSAKSTPLNAPATLNVRIESPPLVMYGHPSSSSGALLSGQLLFKISDEAMDIEKFKMRLAVDVTHKRPFYAHCRDCSHQSTDLTTWNFLQGPTTLKKGEHDFPFSFLLPGHLPATMKGGLCDTEYVLKATVSLKNGEVITLSKPLQVSRAILPSELPRHSIRIFPPTHLTANCELPPVIHPIGDFKISMRVDGVVRRNCDTKTQVQWKLKRLTWRLEEVQKSISPACSKHAPKLGAGGETSTKGTPHKDTRVIGSREVKSGWKADFSTADGCINMEFDFGIRDAHPICDMKSEDGTEVSHFLIVEMVVGEEFAPILRPAQGTPTGAARILRMHFNITVTERSGLGISWDEEQPPLYENVPASPPAYGNSELLDGETIPDYEI